MKRTYRSICMLAWLFWLTGCDGMLDIEPEDTLVETDVFAEEDLAARALGETYLRFAQATAGTAYTLGDFTTEITDSEETEFYNKFIDGNLGPEDETVADFWLSYYSVINLANSLIVKIPEFGQYDPEVEEQHVAEAKFIRAFAYLHLLNLFGEGSLTGNMGGLGLPLQLTPFKGYNQNKNQPVARSSVQETYDQIIKDLEAAIEVLPDFYEKDLDTRTRATKASAQALLSRIYLYMGEYEKAAQYAADVLSQSTVFQFEEELLDLFPDNSERTVTAFSKEYIFGLPFALDQMGNNSISYGYYYKLSIWANEDFVAGYEEGDLRADTLIYAGDTQYNQHLTKNRRTTFKFTEAFGRDHVPMIRLSEVMLTRAETLARTEGVNQESIDILNRIRSRAIPGVEDLDMEDFTAQELIDRILLERKFELAFEGLHRYDLIRTGRPLRNPSVDPDRIVFPIPQSDIDLSGNVLKQNPGYR